MLVDREGIVKLRTRNANLLRSWVSLRNYARPRPAVKRGKCRRCNGYMDRLTKVAFWSYGLAVARSRKNQDRCEDHVFNASETMPPAAINGIMTMACCSQDGVDTKRGSERKRMQGGLDSLGSRWREIAAAHFVPPSHLSAQHQPRTTLYCNYTKHNRQHATIAWKQASKSLVGYEQTPVAAPFSHKPLTRTPSNHRHFLIF